MQRGLRERLKLVLAFIGFLWLVFLAGRIFPVHFESFGLRPRTANGLIGIATMPFLHGNLGHIISNTIPLCILLFLLAGSQERSTRVIGALIICGGSLLWLTGRSEATHVGASGLIYGLITFLIVVGIRERRFLSLVISLLTGFLFGGTLFSGILPTVGESVSWDGHLTGALAGVLIAIRTQDRSG